MDLFDGKRIGKAVNVRIEGCLAGSRDKRRQFIDSFPEFRCRFTSAFKPSQSLRSPTFVFLEERPHVAFRKPELDQ